MLSTKEKKGQKEGCMSLMWLIVLTVCSRKLSEEEADVNWIV